MLLRMKERENNRRSEKENEIHPTKFVVRVVFFFSSFDIMGRGKTSRENSGRDKELHDSLVSCGKRNQKG